MHLSRRKFLYLTSLITAHTIFIPKFILANPPKDRFLYLSNIHTGEYFKDIYWTNGNYINESLKKINKLFRDRRNNKIKQINPKLLDLLSKLLSSRNKPLELVCGYRSSETNNILRKTNHGVAKNSFHMYGKAADIRSPSLSLKNLRNKAKSLKMGGVGYYPSSKFIHVDIRNSPTYW